MKKLTVDKLFTINDVWAHTGIDRRTIGSYLDGFEPHDRNKKSKFYTMAQVAGAFHPYLAKQSGIGAAKQASDDPDDLPPGDRDKHYAAEIKKRNLEVIEGDLIPRAEVLDVISTAFKSLSLGVDIISDRVELHCGLEPDQVEQVNKVTSECKQNLYDDLVVAINDW